MKKIIAIFVLAAGLVSGTVQAQNKFAFIRVDEMVSLMPELKKIDTLLVSYQNDTLPKTYNYLLSQYQRYDSIVNDSIKQPLVVRQQAARERADYLNDLQNWQASAQQLIEGKQNALLQPVYDKVLKAIDEVAKEKGYNYVFNREALLVGPPADNLLPMVAEKLKVKLPTATNPQSTTKPAAKTNN
ncbi:MAG TPA: OmpH family outer membrane protein [Chitinophagaceae bacterium]|jgi:outer membrane protein|nr:OmpH family outer membrane protein [Chitinophagaceae bacterium]